MAVEEEQVKQSFTNYQPREVSQNNYKEIQNFQKIQKIDKEPTYWFKDSLENIQNVPQKNFKIPIVNSKISINNL